MLEKVRNTRLIVRLVSAPSADEETTLTALVCVMLLVMTRIPFASVVRWYADDVSSSTAVERCVNGMVDIRKCFARLTLKSSIRRDSYPRIRSIAKPAANRPRHPSLPAKS